MTETLDQVRWTSADLNLLPDNGTRYEIIDGVLYMTSAPHRRHQRTCGNTYLELELWSRESSLGEPIAGPGVIFTDDNNVIPDVVWISTERLAVLEDEAGHLQGAPELVIEVLSEGSANERRDREVKLKLYAARGAQEYWILNWRIEQVEVYRREWATLRLVETLFADDTLTSPLLPGFACAVRQLFQ